MGMPPVGREAAQILLDAVSAYSPEASEAGNDRAINLALERLHEIGAVTATIDSGSDAVSVDVSNIAAPAVVLLYWLARTAAQAPRDEHDVIAELREFITETV